MEGNNVTNVSSVDGESKRRTRALAKQNVAQSWASRRQQRTSREDVLVQPASKQHQSLPVCVFLKSIWSQTSEWFRLQQQQQQSKPSSRRRILKSSGSIDGDKRPLVFESVTRQHVARAVASQVVEMEDDDNSIVTSVLPAGYDFTQAIQTLAKSRKRAFLLLDLAAVCKAHVQLRKSLPMVELQYCCALNHDDRLLKLLGRLQTSMRCNSNQDVVAAALAMDNSTHGFKIVDHAGATRKPNGYLKRMSVYTNSFAVDGPDEVHRIHNVLTRKAKVQEHIESATTQHCFVLRLPNDPLKWQDLVHDTLNAAQSRQLQLGGISADLSPHLDDLNALLQSLVDCCNELSSDPLRVDVTGLPSSGLTPSLERFFEKLQKSIPHASLTADVSHLLVAHAGALCTRIIGVKRSNPTTEEAQKDNSSIAMHYYIDDGCYGSLQNGLPGHEFSPMPLTNATTPDNDAKLLLSTVWGPTCDGLDRVCREVLLPPLAINDWLVFPNLGCGGFGGGLGLGTAFNGFEPPDIAYCVLGYFRQA